MRVYQSRTLNTNINFDNCYWHPVGKLRFCLVAFNLHIFKYPFDIFQEVLQQIGETG